MQPPFGSVEDQMRQSAVGPNVLVGEHKRRDGIESLEKVLPGAKLTFGLPDPGVGKCPYAASGFGPDRTGSAVTEHVVAE